MVHCRCVPQKIPRCYKGQPGGCHQLQVDRASHSIEAEAGKRQWRRVWMSRETDRCRCSYTANNSEWTNDKFDSYNEQELWTLRPLDTSPMVWTVRQLDTSHTGQLAYWTFRLQGTLPIGQFAYWILCLIPMDTLPAQSKVVIRSINRLRRRNVHGD